MAAGAGAVIAIIASQNAARASAEARRRDFAYCRMVLGDYDKANAGVGEMREYARCVHVVHPGAPAAPSTGDIIALKILFICGLVGLAIGYYLSDDNWGDRVICSLIGFLVTPMLVAMLVGIPYGVVWLFQ